MRGDDRQPDAMFSYVSAEERVPKDHPLRTIRPMVDAALRDMSTEFDTLYSRVGRPSIPPERLFRALLRDTPTWRHTSPLGTPTRHLLQHSDDLLD